MSTDSSGGPPSLPFLPGGRFLPAAPDLDPAELAGRRAAVGELGAALRETLEACVTSEVGTPELLQAARRARELTALLSATRRPPREAASVDDLPASIRMFNPVLGTGNPVAPPLTMEVGPDGSVVGRGVLGQSFEGPFTYTHGGVSALLLDQMVGTAAAVAGHPGMTAQLDVTYRGPVPLHEPLVLVARVNEQDGRKTWVEATIAAASAPDAVLVRARGLLVGLRDDQAERIFGGR